MHTGYWYDPAPVLAWISDMLKQGYGQFPQRTPDYWEGWCDALRRAKHIHENKHTQPITKTNNTNKKGE